MPQNRPPAIPGTAACASLLPKHPLVQDPAAHPDPGSRIAPPPTPEGTGPTIRASSVFVSAPFHRRRKTDARTARRSSPSFLADHRPFGAALSGTTASVNGYIDAPLTPVHGKNTPG